MIRRLAALLLLVPVAPALGQLPLLTAPSGTLRIEIGGAFLPVDRLRVDGASMLLGERLTTASLDAAATPMIGNLQASVATLLQRPSSAYSLGKLTANAEQQRGVATIGLGVGISRRITLSAQIPFVSVRTQLQLRPDATGASVGLNPADPSLGSGVGAAQTATFFTSFDAALSDLARRITAGEFSDPTRQALAQRSLADGTLLRDGLFRLLADPSSASAVLPLASSPDGSAVLGAIQALDATLITELNGAGIGSVPALPSSVLSTSALEALVRAPTGFGIAKPEDLALVGLGDIEVGLTAEVYRRGSPSASRWMAIWAHAGGRLSTGTIPRATLLLDQGTGDGQPDVDLGGTVELGRGRFGVRASLGTTLQLSGTALERPGTRDQLLRPARSTTLLTRNPGDLVTLTAQPYYRIVPHLALTGMLQHQRRGRDDVTFTDPEHALPGLDLDALGAGTNASVTRVALGLSFVHDGMNREGVLKMPVEAGFSIERTIASGTGVVTTPLTTRIVFRVYKALTKR